jgi:hypothetical protein
MENPGFSKSGSLLNVKKISSSENTSPKSGEVMIYPDGRSTGSAPVENFVSLQKYERYIQPLDKINYYKKYITPQSAVMENCFYRLRKRADRRN